MPSYVFENLNVVWISNQFVSNALSTLATGHGILHLDLKVVLRLKAMVSDVIIKTSVFDDTLIGVVQ